MTLGEFNFRLFFGNRQKALNQALKVDALSAKELRDLQFDKLKKLIAHAQTHSPYFKSYPTINTIEEISQLPLMSKDIIRQNVDLIKATNYSEEDLKKNSTSGSSGDALHFYSDNKLDHFRQAIAMRGNYWAGQSFGQPLLLLWGSVADVNKAKQLKTKLVHSPLLFNQKILSSFLMTEADIVEHISTINSFKPAVIVGYPSSLEAFSDYVIKHNVKVHTPNGIITSGETMYESQRERIEKAFGSKVMNRYGSREMGNIASECPHQNGLHIHQDHVFVEVLDENQNPSKPGQLGELVVTDLDNLGFPMLRYRIGDLGVLTDELCTCGRPYQVLKKVEGRVFDLIVGTNGNRIPGNYFTLYFRKLPGITKFQVQQSKNLEVNVLLVTTSEYTPETEAKLIDGLKQKLGADISLSLKQVDEIQPTASGKHRWVISEASPFI